MPIEKALSPPFPERSFIDYTNYTFRKDTGAEMIERYECIEISEIWGEENKFYSYLEAELALLKALEDASIAPKGNADSIRKKVKIDPKRVQEIEREVHHDVIAFCTSITEQLEVDEARYFHYGATSSDVIDTATNLQVKKSLEKILDVFSDYLGSLWGQVEKNENLLGMGRSHGIYAEPLIYSQKFLSFFVEGVRSYQILEQLKNELTAQFSGAVGSYTVLDHEIEKKAASYLDLKVEDVSSQVIPRDHFARIVSNIAILGSSLERLAVELRHLQHSDIGELAEGFSKGQKGSSTMPHKKNPISSENITGMARLLRSYNSIALENIPLWHERDISHSSTERVYLPDCFGFLYYSLKRMSGVLKNLVIDEKKVEEKVESQSIILSSYYLHYLLKETKERREDLYRIIQESSFVALEKGVSLQAEIERKIDISLPDMNFTAMKKHYKNRYQQTKKRVVAKYGEVWDFCR